MSGGAHHYESWTMNDSTDKPPHAQIVDMALSFWVPRAIYVAARLGIADLLADGKRSSVDLAKSTDVDGPSLYRLLRALTNIGCSPRVLRRPLR